MDNKAFSLYMSVFGFALLVAGLIVAYSSLNTMQTSYVALADSSIVLLCGVLVSVAGGALLLIGLFASKRATRRIY